MEPTTIAIDLAKRVFQIHFVDTDGTIHSKALKRAQMLPFFANRPAARIVMEACGSAHHWARQLSRLGHEVRLIAAQFVRPFVKSNKNDAADAAAIWEASQRPGMRFVAVKSADQVLQSPRFRHLHAAEPRPPRVERRVTEPVLPA
ncbi:Transposase (plasmid) [Mycetohabitans rhizoxinica HKI 454]|uniref:Transposase n=1 Tax=Mycetohabitans rhizoxinica (strain DSM 19002 / CIP 109453 / HKI 454) TaxID=882378 RepID=E5AWA7_MYCRK|nr:Transposase [Mycetohabitans rhizoxinica HKI 454]